jgi:RND family efflux transporter MFP subunit
MRLLLILLILYVNLSFSKEAVVNVINPKYREVPIYYEANANLKADISVNLKPEVSGRITDLLIKEGDSVTKGQVLAKIESEDYNYQYQAQKFTVERLNEIYNYNLSVFKRKEFLYKKGLISQDEYLLAKSNMETSYNELMAAKQQLNQLETQLKRTIIKAPFNSVVDKKFINVGDYVTPATNLFYLIDPKSIKVVFYLPQRFVKSLKLGENVNVDIQDVGKFTAKISYISYSLTPENLLEVKADIPFNKLFKEGMYAKVKVLEKKIKAFIVPERAVFMKDTENYVLKVENGKTKKVKVNIIDQLKGFLIVEGDLKESDNIVVDAPFNIQEGMKVKIGEKL